VRVDCECIVCHSISSSLNLFVESSSSGSSWLTYEIQSFAIRSSYVSVFHLTDDARRMGPLRDTSMYPFLQPRRFTHWLDLQASTNVTFRIIPQHSRDIT
jgi:hypothetical protein